MVFLKFLDLNKTRFLEKYMQHKQDKYEYEVYIHNKAHASIECKQYKFRNFWQNIESRAC